MSQFRPAFEFVMDHEDYSRSGVISAEPNGARARWGINSRAHHELDLDAMDSIDKAAAWYELNTWQTGPFSKIDNQTVANKYYDMFINMGMVQATKLLQRSLNTLSGAAATAVSGRCNDLLVGAINAADSGLLLYQLRGQCAAFYRRLAERNPTVYARFLPGWLRRATS